MFITIFSGNIFSVTRASAVDRGGGVSGGLMIWDQVNMCFVYVCAAEECAGVVAY